MKGFSAGLRWDEKCEMQHPWDSLLIILLGSTTWSQWMSKDIVAPKFTSLGQRLAFPKLPNSTLLDATHVGEAHTCRWSTHMSVKHIYVWSLMHMLRNGGYCLGGILNHSIMISHIILCNLFIRDRTPCLEAESDLFKFFVDIFCWKIVLWYEVLLSQLSIQALISPWTFSPLADIFWWTDFFLFLWFISLLRSILYVLNIYIFSC